jgi:hypothetical protein
MKIVNILNEGKINNIHRKLLNAINNSFDYDGSIEDVWRFLSDDLSIDDMDLKIEVLHLYNQYNDEEGFNNLQDSDLDNIENVDDEKIMALSLFLVIPPILIEDMMYSHFDMSTYKDLTTEKVYAVGDESEVEESMRLYFSDFVDNQGGLENIDRYLLDDYIEIDEYAVRDFAREEAEYFVDEMDEDDVISEAGYDKDDVESVIEDLEEKISEFSDEIESLESEMNDLISDNIKYKRKKNIKKIEDLEGRIDELMTEISDLESQLETEKSNLESLYETAKEELIDKKEEEIYDNIEYSGVDYFTNELGFSFTEAVSRYFSFDESGLEEYLAENEDRGQTLGPYDGQENEQYYDGTYYFIYRTD